MKETTASTPVVRSFSLEWGATLAILAAYVVWVLSLPAFPSQDGPAHLYFVYVMHALLGHTDPVLGRFYTIKHMLPPYSLYYYTLMLLTRFVPFLLADRMVIATYFLSFVFGFRFLAKSVGPGADRATLLATVLLVNWPLGMGFANYCLSVSFSFWALGLWFRFQERPGLAPRVGFVLLAIAIMLTHPVPLLVTLGVCTFSLGFQLLQARRADSPGKMPPNFVANAATYILAGLCLGYIRLFVNSTPLDQPVAGGDSFAQRFLHRARIFYRGTGLNPLTDTGHFLFVYRKGLLLILLVALGLAGWQMFRNRKVRLLTRGDMFLVLSLLFTAVLPALPPVLNGSSFFAERLLIFVWLFALLAACGSPVASHAVSYSKGVSIALVVFAVAINLVFLRNLDSLLRPLGREFAAVDAAAIGHTGQSGLLLDQRAWDLPRRGPAWDPYYWTAADLFRRNDDVLINPPWLTLAIIPLGATPALQREFMGAQIDDVPNKMWDALQESAEDRTRLLAASDFVVLLSSDRSKAPETDPVLDADSRSDRPWVCHAGAVVWYQVCDRR